MLSKQIQISFYCLFILILFSSCNFYTKKGISIVEQEKNLPPLDSGVVYYQKFDTLIHLKGEKIMDDTLARKISRLFLKDTLLITFDSEWDFQINQPLQKFKHYSLPNMQFSKSVEEHFNFSYIIPTVDSTLLFYMWGYEPKYGQQSHSQEQKLCKYDLSGKITLIDSITLPIGLNSNVSSIIHVGNADFIYHKDSVIVRASITEDTVLVENLYKLPMNPNCGQLIINPAKNRMVFAYQYYHLFHIVDLDAKSVKTVDFKNGNHQYRFEKGFWMDYINPNVTYYDAAFSGKDYFYLIYRGYSYKNSQDHAKGWKWSKKEGKYVKTDEYQQNIPSIVEQYDWNGNPVAQYLLEGNPVAGERSFVVDEKNQKFYILAADCYRFDLFLGGSFYSLMVYSFSKK